MPATDGASKFVMMAILWHERGVQVWLDFINTVKLAKNLVLQTLL